MNKLEYRMEPGTLIIYENLCDENIVYFKRYKNNFTYRINYNKTKLKASLEKPGLFLFYMIAIEPHITALNPSF